MQSWKANQTTDPGDSSELKTAITKQPYAFDQPNQEFIEEVTDI
jgi:hypothetical protein